MKDVNQELEGNRPAWDSNLGRWIEPDEVFEDKTPVVPNEVKGKGMTDSLLYAWVNGKPAPNDMQFPDKS